MFERRKITYPWEGKIEPFGIIGNVYFVGTFQASCHIIDTGEGLIAFCEKRLDKVISED